MPTERRRQLRVVLADGHPLIRTNLHRLLAAEEDLDVVAVAWDGAAATKAVRAAGRAAPIVVVSGAEGTERIATDLRAVAFLAKPFSIDELTRVVRTAAAHAAA